MTAPVRTPSAAPAPAPGPSRSRERLAALGSLLALASLLIGLPVALALLVGWPLPDRVPTGAELLDTVRRPITDQMLVNALALVFWFAWLQIVVCTVIEARAALRGVGVPRRVPLAGATQHLTRKLVATSLLLLTATTVLTPVTASATRAVLPERATTSISAAADSAVTATPTTTTTATAAGAATTGAIPQRADDVQVAPAADADATALASTLVGRKVLTVLPPDGRNHMSLWEIAEAHLGDGRRYKEVFALNEGREQPRMGVLAKARLIQPGWHLLMPDDAVGVPVISVPETPAPASAPAPVEAPVDQAPIEQAPAEQGAAEVAPVTGATGSGAAETTADPVAAEEDVLVSLLALAQAGLLSAGLLTALRRMRRVQQRRRGLGAVPPLPTAELVRAEVALRLEQDPEGVRDLDTALRLLSERQSRQLLGVPDLVAAVVDAEQVRLHLAATSRPVPAPFTAADAGGALWQADRAALPDARPSVLAPYPALVSLGGDDDGQLLVDLESVGVLALSGPRSRTTALLRSLAVELATSDWADHLELTLVGFGERLAPLQPERVRHVATLADAIGPLEARLAALDPARTGARAVLDSRTGAGDPLMPQVVLIAEQQVPDPQVLARLQVLAQGLGQRCGLALVTGEDVPSATWTVRVAADGTATVAPFGASVQVAGLDDDAWEAVGALVAAAAAPVAAGQAADAPALVPPPLADQRPDGGSATGLRSVRLPSLADVPGGLTAVPDLTGPELADPDAVPSVELVLLGPVQVTGVGPAPHPHCVELVALLALHPQGLDLPAVGRTLQPRDEPAEATRAAQVLLARTRSWLGRDADGHELLPPADDQGLLHLAPAVAVDWHRFQALSARPKQALTLVRGQAFTGVPARRWSWLVATGLEQRVPAAVVDTAVAVGSVCLERDDLSGARAAAEAGLRADWLDERLWRLLLEATARSGDTARVAELADQLERVVGSELAPYDGLQPETAALLERLTPRGPERAAN